MATIIARPERRPSASNPEKIDMATAAHGRVMLMLLLLAAVTIVLAARMTWIGVQGNARSDRAIGATPIPMRADIVDRNGVPLARNIDGYAVAVHPDKIMGDKRELAQKLAAIFPDQTADQFYAVLSSTKKWSYLRRRALPNEVAAVNALGEIAIEFPREKERLYPQRSLAAHLIGFTNIDGHGGMGVERFFDKRLIDEKLRNTPLALSIDTRAQAALEEEMIKGVTAQRAKGAAGIVLDVHTGEVVAMVSVPTFNPNKFEVPKPPMVQGRDGKWRPGVIQCDDLPLCNRVVQARYELGSVFKPLSIGAAMDAGTVTDMAKRYDATKPLEIAGRTIHDHDALNRWMNIPEALIHSSNIVAARIADEMGPGPLQKLYRDLEFDRRASIELLEQDKTIWPGDWGRLTNMTASYGHGIAITPMHLASAYAALVNGGIWHPATVLKVTPGQTIPERRVFSSATSARMRQLLRMIVQSGTGRNGNADGYRIGAKTGTGEKPGVGGYSKHSNVVTFASAFPMDDPKYVVVVVMDEPQGSKESFGLRTAAWTSAPIVKAFVQRVGPLLGVYPEANRDIDISELLPLIGGDKEEAQ
ncbi:MAG: penicillin-binding protein 2 [Sphingobium sp.]|nr:penicillin-binding protein 2 [Sphingobium sp.]